MEGRERGFRKWKGGEEMEGKRGRKSGKIRKWWRGEVEGEEEDLVSGREEEKRWRGKEKER